MPKIGEGTYGCAYNPPLLCQKKKPRSFYLNKITKATTISNANIEVKEQEFVDRVVDPTFKYHLHSPQQCIPNFSLPSNIEYLNSCNPLKDENNHLLPADKISLLMIENGGLDFKKFVKYFVSTSHIGQPPRGFSFPTSNNSTVKTYFSRSESKMKDQKKKKTAVIIEFWRKSVILIDAIGDFLKNKSLHHDLKPENVVYDHIKNRFNIIDFGLAKKFEDYHPKRTHFSYPPETYVLNPDIYRTVSTSSVDNFKSILGIEPFDEDKPFMYSYKYFINYVSPENMIYSPHYDVKYGFKTQDEILEFFNSNFYQGRTIEEIQKKAMMTHDMYGMGLALMYVFVRTYYYLIDINERIPNKSLKVKRIANETLFIQEMYKILFSMIHPDCFQRPNIEVLKKKYRRVLKLLPHTIRSLKTRRRSPTPHGWVRSIRGRGEWGSME